MKSKSKDIIIKIMCLEDIKAPSFMGCDAYEYCINTGNMYTKYKKGNIYLTTLKYWEKAVHKANKGWSISIPIVKELWEDMVWKNVSREYIYEQLSYGDNRFLFKRVEE